MNTYANADENFTMANVFTMFVVDIILYALITFYFDGFMPGEYGTSQPFYFPFTVREGASDYAEKGFC